MELPRRNNNNVGMNKLHVERDKGFSDFVKVTATHRHSQMETTYRLNVQEVDDLVTLLLYAKKLIEDNADKDSG